MQEITERLGADVVIEAVGSPVTYVMAVDESVSQDGWFVSATLKVKLLSNETLCSERTGYSWFQKCITCGFPCGDQLYEGGKLSGGRVDNQDCKT